MEESAVSLAAQHIGTMIDEDHNAIISNVLSEVESLRTELRKLDKLLIAVESNKRRLANNPEVRPTLMEVRRIAYEAEDVVDNYVSETECTTFSSLIGLRPTRGATKKLRGLKERVQKIIVSLNGYNEGSSKAPSRPRQLQVLTLQQVHRPANDDFVVGINADVERLVTMLVGKSKDVHGNKIRHIPSTDVLAIVGMGGSGKSTIARSIYYHKDVREHFQYQAWASLSQGWYASDDLLPLLSEIYKQITGGSQSRKDLLRLAPEIIEQNQGHHNDEQSNEVKTKSQLQDLLEKHKCLVVLDNVWDWELLQKIVHALIQPCDPGASKSKIVITSRQRFLWPEPYLKWDFHETKLLGDEDSWKLFKKATSSDNVKTNLAKEYRGLAKDMLKMCKGLPLTIVALGRLLRKKDTIQEWERVFSHLKGEDGPYLYGPVNDVLALSYYELPNYLKPCFLYLGLLAKESTISAGTLMRMWIAEGFVKRQQQVDETLEQAARRLLQELVNHTMVQVVTKTYNEKVNKLQVHDLMRDICIKIAEEQEFLTLFSSDFYQSSRTHSRRAAINISKCSTLCINNSNLRTLLVIGKSSTGLNQQETLNLSLVFEEFKLLRVLDIKGIKTFNGAMPKEIGTLVHLRYLGITSTNIQKLPKSIGKLRKLVTLDYWNVSVSDEIRLPNVFWKLEHLRHLFLPNEMMSEARIDLKLDTLKELQTLWGVKGGDWMLKEMNSLSSSVTKLYIQGISTLEQLNAVLNMADHLHVLVLDWYGFALDSLGALLEKNNLRKLRLMGRVPDTVNALKFPDGLQKLELYYTHIERQETMDNIGELRSLKILGLAKDSFIGDKWKSKGGNTFLKLEELKLSNLPKFKNWEIEEGAMPCLKRLSIASCTKLTRLPEELKSILTLDTLDIAHMTTDFNSTLKKWNATSGEDAHNDHHIRNMVVKDSSTLVSL